MYVSIIKCQVPSSIARLPGAKTSFDVNDSRCSFFYQLLVKMESCLVRAVDLTD